MSHMRTERCTRVSLPWLPESKYVVPAAAKDATPNSAEVRPGMNVFFLHRKPLLLIRKKFDLGHVFHQVLDHVPTGDCAR